MKWGENFKILEKLSKNTDFFVVFGSHSKFEDRQYII